ACGRYFAEILSGIILCIGYIMAAFDDEKRALHDRICGTRVIKKPGK
ncbi:MAG TPA: RDD family protein, partial [Nitrospiria bacterium]|nr:RDD family protein [Nitrospiria bacterium]